jgi:hypothetical protein
VNEVLKLRFHNNLFTEDCAVELFGSCCCNGEGNSYADIHLSYSVCEVSYA